MIDIKQFPGMLVTPKDDAILYDFILNSSGITEGCTVTSLGANQLKILSGRGIIKGRIFAVEEEVILAKLPTTGSQSGRLIIRLDISNTEAPIQFVTQIAAALPALTQEDINRGGTVFELPLTLYDATAIQIANLQSVAPTINMPDNRYAPTTHNHTKSQITDFPTSMPANGGNAATATKLQTPRQINGVNFDGSANITITAAANGGNAATATKLQTAWSIQTNLGYANGETFDGTKGIHPGVFGVLGVGNGGTGRNDGAFIATPYNVSDRQVRNVATVQNGQPWPYTVSGDIIHVYN